MASCEFLKVYFSGIYDEQEYRYHFLLSSFHPFEQNSSNEHNKRSEEYFDKR